jgi:hypothetical protein
VPLLPTGPGYGRLRKWSGKKPGMGQLYVLGNKLYVSGEGLRHIANTSQNFQWSGSRKVRSLNEDEKIMLDIGPGDRGLAIEQVATIKGKQITCYGYGLLDKNELDARGSNGRAMPGRGSKKDIYQTLVTRAERDIYKHFLPLVGCSVAPEPGEIIDVTPEFPSEQKRLEKWRDVQEKQETETKNERAIEELKASLVGDILALQKESGYDEPLHNLSTATEQELDSLLERIKLWITESKNKSAKKAKATAKKDLPVEENPLPTIAPSETDIAVWQEINKILASEDKPKPEVKELLERLLKCERFKDTDRLEIIRFAREANAGKKEALTNLQILTAKREIV